eukprot:2748390-Amphidinium_carterae.1
MNAITCHIRLQLCFRHGWNQRSSSKAAHMDEMRDGLKEHPAKKHNEEDEVLIFKTCCKCHRLSLKVARLL